MVLTLSPRNTIKQYGFDTFHPDVTLEVA